MAEQYRISVVIPVYNQVELLDRCLASLALQEGCEVEAIVVDDASPQDPGPVLQKYPWARAVRLERNVGYAEANNRGLAVATGQFIVFLNSDTEVPRDGLRRMADYLVAHPEAGGASPLHREPSGATQRTCFGFPTLRSALIWDSVWHRRRPDHPVVRAFTLADWDHASDRWVEHAQTSCLMVRREVYDQIGGMDPKLRLFYNDTDFCFRMYRAGYQIRFLADVEIVHHGGASVGTFEKADEAVYGDRYRYCSKWFGWRGRQAVRTALWSRVGYEMLVELAHGDIPFAMRKVRRGLKLDRALIGAAR